jgi:hypothetical protein
MHDCNPPNAFPLRTIWNMGEAGNVANLLREMSGPGQWQIICHEGLVGPFKLHPRTKSLADSEVTPKILRFNVANADNTV